MVCEYFVVIDSFINVHASSKIEFCKVQDNEDFANIHEIDSPLCICNALIDDVLVDHSNCVRNFNVSNHAFEKNVRQSSREWVN